MAKANQGLWFPKFQAVGHSWKKLDITISDQFKVTNREGTEKDRQWLFEHEMIERFGEARTEDARNVGGTGPQEVPPGYGA